MNRYLAAPLAVAVLAVMAGCGSKHATSVTTLSGSGSSFDAPLFSSAFAAYSKSHRVRVNYQALGSGTGQTDLNAGTVDFAAFDVPMLKSDGFANFPKIVQFPVTLGGVSIIYNLPTFSGTLKLTGAVLAQIYMGKITKWSAPALTALNPALKTQTGSITVVHRSDSSGTSYIFTDFLSHTSPAWASKYGASKLPAWPVGLGGSHSTGVSADVNSTGGAIGYVETAYALQNPHKGVGQAAVQNKAGTFLKPSLAAVAADASQVAAVTPTHFSIVDSPGSASYPISGFSWAGLYKKESDATKCKAVVALFKWETTAGQKYGPPIDYVKLPSADSSFAGSQLAKVTC